MSLAAPALAAALIAFDPLATYTGLALAVAPGGMRVAPSGSAGLHWVGLGWVLAARGLQIWVARCLTGSPARA